MLRWPTELNRGTHGALRFPPHHTKYLSHPVLVNLISRAIPIPLVICNETTHTALPLCRNPIFAICREFHPRHPDAGSVILRRQVVVSIRPSGSRRTVFCLVLPNILFVRLYRRNLAVASLFGFAGLETKTRLRTSEMFFHVVVSEKSHYRYLQIWVVRLEDARLELCLEG